VSKIPGKVVALFENPFSIEDLLVFDDAAMQHMLSSECLRPAVEDLAWSLHGASKTLVERIRDSLPLHKRDRFCAELRRPISRQQVKAARRRVLDSLFWELTYWKTPELYEELTEGEQIHPGIFQRLEPDLRGKTVLDIGAGSGRASFECIRHGASLVYAVEPSPGLMRILERKLVGLLTGQPDGRIVPYPGRFDQIPLGDNCVDVSLSCSAFTAEPEQGGEAGLAELKRVTKPGGKIVIIWPRREDYDWLVGHGFQYVALPLDQQMWVRFRSLQSALHCARLFYAHNKAVATYILERRQPEVPFSVLGFNPPRDYCWLDVT
jgi:SAM-dependent methyltransferase